MKRYALVALVLATASVVAGCYPTTLRLPESYVRLEDAGSDYTDRVVSADGVTIGLRRRQAAQDGSLAFWAKAIRNQLTGGKGYSVKEESDIKSTDGEVGRRMDFTSSVKGNPFAYAVAVWVHAGQVIVAEAGGPTQAFAADAEEIGQSLSAVKVRG